MAASAGNGNGLTVIDAPSLESLCAAPRTQTVRNADARLLDLLLRTIRDSRYSGTLTVQFQHGSACGAVRLEQYTP